MVRPVLGWRTRRGVGSPPGDPGPCPRPAPRARAGASVVPRAARVVFLSAHRSQHPAYPTAWWHIPWHDSGARIRVAVGWGLYSRDRVACHRLASAGRAWGPRIVLRWRAARAGASAHPGGLSSVTWKQQRPRRPPGGARDAHQDDGCRAGTLSRARTCVWQGRCKASLPGAGEAANGSAGSGLSISLAATAIPAPMMAAMMSTIPAAITVSPPPSCLARQLPQGSHVLGAGGPGRGKGSYICPGG
jgi:hypothetical protein